MKKLGTILLFCLGLIVFSVTSISASEVEIPEPTTPTTSTTYDGEALSNDGDVVTRDLLYDEKTNKQFITIETRNGETFYLIIDYDKPVDDKLEQYHAYFLNAVDERDLLQLLDKEDQAEWKESTEPEILPIEPEEEKKKSGNDTGTLLFGVVAAAGFGYYGYKKFSKKKNADTTEIENEFENDDEFEENESEEEAE